MPRVKVNLYRKDLDAPRLVNPAATAAWYPAEWVSVSSLEGYRQALESFLTQVPERLGE